MYAGDGIWEETHYRWKEKYDGVEPSAARQPGIWTKGTGVAAAGGRNQHADRDLRFLITTNQ